MSNEHRGMIALFTGLIMLMGAMGGIEEVIDLTSQAGLYLFAFSISGLALMMVGVSYVAEQTEQTRRKLRSLP